MAGYIHSQTPDTVQDLLFEKRNDVNCALSAHFSDGSTIVLYLAKKGLSATAIHGDLEEGLGREAVALKFLGFERTRT
jgi:hypothetical protein